MELTQKQLDYLKTYARKHKTELAGKLKSRTPRTFLNRFDLRDKDLVFTNTIIAVKLMNTNAQEGIDWRGREHLSEPYLLQHINPVFERHHNFSNPQEKTFKVSDLLNKVREMKKAKTSTTIKLNTTLDIFELSYGDEHLEWDKNKDKQWLVLSLDNAYNMLLLLDRLKIKEVTLKRGTRKDVLTLIANDFVGVISPIMWWG